MAARLSFRWSPCSFDRQMAVQESRRGLPKSATGNGYRTENGPCRMVHSPVESMVKALARPPLNFVNGPGDLNAIHGQELLDVRVLTFIEIGNRPEVDGFAFIQEDDRIGNFPHEIEIVRDDNGG